MVRPVHSHSPWVSSGSFVPVRSIPVVAGGRRVCSCALDPLRAPWGSSGSLGYVRSIAVRPGGCRVRLCAFGLFASWGSLGCVRSIPVLDGGHRVRSCTFGPFVIARSIHSRLRWWSSGSFVCVRSISMRTGVSFVCIRSIPVRPGGRRVRLYAFGPFPCALGFILVHSVYSHAP